MCFVYPSSDEQKYEPKKISLKLHAFCKFVSSHELLSVTDDHGKLLQLKEDLKVKSVLYLTYEVE